MGINSAFMGGVAGAVLGLVLGGTAAGLLALLTPLASTYPQSAPVVAQSATAVLTILGFVGGVAYMRMTTRRPTDEHEADYDDAPRT